MIGASEKENRQPSTQMLARHEYGGVGKPSTQTAGKPWERQPGEPDKAFAKFSYYLQLGTGRSLGQVADAFGISPARVKELSARWRWTLRAIAWQAEAVRHQREEERRQAAEAQQRHLRDAIDWQRIAGISLRSWVTRNERGELELARELSPREALRLWRVGYRAERSLRGASAEPGEEDAPEEALVLEAEVEELERAARSIVEEELIPLGLRDTPLSRLRAERLVMRLVASAAAHRQPSASPDQTPTKGRV